MSAAEGETRDASTSAPADLDRREQRREREREREADQQLLDDQAGDLERRPGCAGRAIGDRREPERERDRDDARARAGIIFDENSGASTNSGPTRASTRKKPVTLAPRDLRDELVERRAGSSLSHQSCGIEM